MSKYKYRHECEGVSFDTGRERIVVMRSSNTFPRSGWQAQHVAGWRVAWRLLHGEGPRCTRGNMWSIGGKRYRTKGLALARMECMAGGRSPERRILSGSILRQLLD